MSELYGVRATLGTTQGTTPVSTSTEVVFIGGCNCTSASAHLNEPIIIRSQAEYKSKYGGSAQVGDGWSLSEAVEAAFSVCNIDHIILINVFNPDSMSDEEDITSSIILGDSTDNTGIYALNKIFPTYGLIPNIVCCPLMTSSTLNAGLKLACTKINGKFDAILVCDVVEASSQVVSGIAQPSVVVASKASTGADERIILNWGHIKVSSGSILSGAAVKACLYAQSDAQNSNLPSRSIGNLYVPGMQYLTLKDDDSAITLSDEDATDLSADGITSFINIGGNQFYTWGDHTSAFSAGTVSDERARFDSNIRMLYHLTNRFQLKWRSIIDSPMTLALRNNILNYEQNYLNFCVAKGALIGSPLIEFRPDDNQLETLQQGQFYFVELATVVPPSKFIDLKLSFTSDGFKVYLEA